MAGIHGGEHADCLPERWPTKTTGWHPRTCPLCDEDSVSSIDVRDLRFDLSTVPRDWHPRGAAVTAFWDQFSVFFPVGEAFFVRSVRHFLPQLSDETLRADVAAFCAQEG
ncbi:MAG: metal-dependent hydrolase, partial [Archangium sp.]|nr:metal-dependent hydrolase [Archangium sp.]